MCKCVENMATSAPSRTRLLPIICVHERGRVMVFVLNTDGSESTDHQTVINN